MAVSCSEVMYGAYYPYLYGRGAARSFHHAPHFQYDRFNVGSGGVGVGGVDSYGGGAGGGGGSGGGAVGALSTGSGSSGAQSPASPPHAHLHHHSHQPHTPHQPHQGHTPHQPHTSHAPRLRAKEEDLSAHGRASADGNGGSSDSEGECGGGGSGAGGRARAQYVSANCVVFTHYSGDVAAVVDEHFARALSVDKPKESVPMVSRNLPASFFNAAAAAGVPCGMELYEYDPWAAHAHAHASHYAHHPHASHYAHAPPRAHEYAHGVAHGYQQLLLGRTMPQYKPVEWGQGHHLDAAPYSYPAVPGLEAQVQDSSKDLYWF